MVPRRRKKVRGHQSTTWRCLFVTRAGSFVTVLLIVGLIVGTVPTGALAAASSHQAHALVLPVGEPLDDESLAEVQGEFMPVVAGVAIYVGKKLIDSAWDNVVEPFLEEKVWKPARDFLGLE